MCHGCGCTGLQLLLCVMCCSPWLCCAPQREPRSAPVSLGLRPHSHLGHREKECADLMMYRKSDEPHSDPGAAIGRHCSSEKPSPLWTRAPYKRHVEPEYVDPLTISLHGDAVLRCYALGLFHFSSHLCRGRGGLSEARQRAGGLKLSARSSSPLKADGKLVGGTEGLSTEADCHKWLQLLLRPWSWLQ